MSELQIPEVRRVHADGGSHIEPPLESNWSNDQKLSWHAAVIWADTGIKPTIHQGTLSHKTMIGRWVTREDSYSIGFGTSTTGPFDYHSAWDYLNGLESGFKVGVAQADRG